MAQRAIKAEVQGLLAAEDWRERLAELRDKPFDAVIGALLSLRLSPREEIRWRAVAAFGEVVPAMAERDYDAARKVMGRFMWMMNEESGNIGWGIPEAMGEIMARHDGLAEDYHKKLSSFIQRPECEGDDNYMDHPPLREATYWGLGRLARSRPDLVLPAVPDMIVHLDHEEASEFLCSLLVEETAAGKGYICWALGLTGAAEGKSAVEKHVGSEAELTIFRNYQLERTTLGALAREALERLE